MEFKVIKHSGSVNKCSIGDIFYFEDKEHTVNNITSNYVYFEQGLKFPKKLFFRWVRLSLRYKKLAKEKKQELTKLNNEGTYNYKPTMSRRYVVVVDNNQNYIWLFESRHTSHSQILLDFQKKYQTSEIWYSPVFGGFYNFRCSNAIAPQEKAVLELFGKSDSFGFRRENYEYALPELKRLMNYIPIDQSWIDENYPKKDSAL